MPRRPQPDVHCLARWIPQHQCGFNRDHGKRNYDYDRPSEYNHDQASIAAFHHNDDCSPAATDHDATAAGRNHDGAPTTSASALDGCSRPVDELHPPEQRGNLL